MTQATAGSSRSISLFSPQARDLLARPLRLLADSSPSAEAEKVVDGKEVSAYSTEGVVSECNACHVSFEDRAEQLVHYRLDWHRYNLKRRLRGLTHVSQAKFEEEAGDLSSISGSESDSEDASETTPTNSTHQSSPFVYFMAGDSSTLYSVYRVALTGGKDWKSSDGLLPSLHSLTQPQLWVILMTAGGHFAGAVFSGDGVVVHKTFHRYTIRAKSGTAQSVRDGQSGGHGPKSAGASLRRYNEAALEREIQSLLQSWATHLQQAAAIFLRAPKTRQSIFTGGRTPLVSRDDPRVRGIPFATRRPTLKEVKQVHSCLASIYHLRNMSERTVGMETVSVAMQEQSVETEVVVKGAGGDCGEGSESVDGVCVDGGNGDCSEGEDSGVDGDSVQKERRKKRKKKKKKPDVSWREMLLSPALGELLALCERGGGEDEVTDVLRNLRLRPLYPVSEATPTTNESEQQTDDDILNRLYGGVSPLHVASEHGHKAVVNTLLEHGADPTVKDSGGRVPYVVAREKAVRDCYRRFMGQWPEAHDYSTAQVPSPLTEEMERERREKAAEKKREKKRQARKKLEEQKAKREEEELARRQREAAQALSEREKRAMAAEKRLALQGSTDSSVQRAGACSYCGCGLAGLVPFHRLQYHYCSMQCVKEHRNQLDKP